jgi:hypothetical protein
VADGPDNVFGVFADTDFPYPDVKRSDGRDGSDNRQEKIGGKFPVDAGLRPK